MAHRDLFYNFIGLMRLGGMKLGSKEKKKKKEISKPQGSTHGNKAAACTPEMTVH